MTDEEYRKSVDEELAKWAKNERYFSNATKEQIRSAGLYFLFIIGHDIPCRCGNHYNNLFDGINHTSLFEIKNYTEI